MKNGLILSSIAGTKGVTVTLPGGLTGVALAATLEVNPEGGSFTLESSTKRQRVCEDGSQVVGSLNHRNPNALLLRTYENKAPDAHITQVSHRERVATNGTFRRRQLTEISQHEYAVAEEDALFQIGHLLTQDSNEVKSPMRTFIPFFTRQELGLSTKYRTGGPRIPKSGGGFSYGCG